MKNKEQPIEVIVPPNLLKAKVGGSGGVFDAGALKRAEGAINELKQEFDTWLSDDVNRLNAARAAYAVNVHCEKARAALYRAAHDLKGQGQTFEFPLVARVASSLCALAEGTGDTGGMPVNLVDAHVDAIKIIVRDKIKDPTNGTASGLAHELEQQVEMFLSKAA
jgi:hypothetical protein